jgi:hypothetical protein
MKKIFIKNEPALINQKLYYHSINIPAFEIQKS